MKRKVWTQEDIDILVKMYPDHYCREVAEILGRSQSSVYCKAQFLGLESSEEKLRRPGLTTSRNPKSIAARFKKGQVPLNKGKKMSPDVYAKCSGTMFKKGNQPHNHREVGSEYIDESGYTWVKIGEPRKWALKHRIIWERANGPIPEGYNVQFKNHDPSDIRLDNLYLISKTDQLVKENSFYAKYPKELQEVIHLKGVVNRVIHNRQKKNGK